MFLTEQTAASIKEVLAAFTGFNNAVQVLRPVTGGSINRCFEIGYGNERFFLKLNCASTLPMMFEAEAKGLKRIAVTRTIRVPELVGFGIAESEQFLLLEWIEKGINNAASQRLLGRNLAQLHKVAHESFGLDYDNYMGSLTQSNKSHVLWRDFFICERLIPQIKLGEQNGLLDKTIVNQFESLFTKLDDFGCIEESSLVHGDLWSGNYMVSHLQEPVLFDPAISFSNREADIAMTALFGGFQNSFYDAYNEEFPLQPGWKTRLDVWNLYPLLIHVNLFGTSYIRSVKEILDRFT